MVHLNKCGKPHSVLVSVCASPEAVELNSKIYRQIISTDFPFFYNKADILILIVQNANFRKEFSSKNENPQNSPKEFECIGFQAQ